tara:strand:+ start:970 stop:2361 length:1392 start_codon:yes stop_codon:yes gene_type:complete
VNSNLRDRIIKLEDMSKELGLDFFPIKFEVASQAVMLEVMSYGLPTRARHWSYGQSYQYQKISGEMGWSKVYELILNNDPSYAFLLETNSDIANTMVIAHCFGHSHFFKNNYLFKQTDRKMVYHAASRAQRIENYIEKYGIEEVEHVMDIGFALDKHIDWHKGVYRKRYSEVALEPSREKKSGDEFEDLLGRPNKDLGNYEAENQNFPPNKETDLLWFITNYSNLPNWKRDILEIIRQESYYFYPQYFTKIMNEGFASYCHAELMYLFDDIDPEDHLEFCKIHERVVQPGSNKLKINPYFLGFSIFNDIKKKWDKKHEDGESEINGLQKMYEIVEEEDDVSFLRNYLSQDVADELKLFAYVKKYSKTSGEYIQVESRDLDDIVEYLTKDLFNYRAPLIAITKASESGIELQHLSKEVGTLEKEHVSKVMEYLFEIWRCPVNLETVDDSGDALHYTFDELGFSG